MRRQQYCSANSEGLVKSSGPYRDNLTSLYASNIQRPIVSNSPSVVVTNTRRLYKADKQSIEVIPIIKDWSK